MHFSAGCHERLARCSPSLMPRHRFRGLACQPPHGDPLKNHIMLPGRHLGPVDHIPAVCFNTCHSRLNQTAPRAPSSRSRGITS